MSKKTLSQNLWLRRKDSDVFFEKAKISGFRARSAYKLLEIENKFKILKNNKNIVDLGASPGSWSQVLVKKNLNLSKIKIFAIDIKDIDPIEGVKFIKKDISYILEGNNYFKKNSLDLVLSDMAPNSTGHRFTDQAKASNLAEKALIFAINYLSFNGKFVCKLLGGNNDRLIINRAKEYFKTIKLFKPTSSRKESKEIYLICLSFNNLQ
ncbi:MAG: Ribosomal RNA large subunit methyltransferase E [Alphaproteobacteria bacterium MarineAlpha9_Bin4]|nr:50S rRNA methyltransferase [Pelagibacterales bacterium]PPR24905.1 MAG: Ribosomal RNA large subunit methyltransferase E [Alphaproteobacteria bacterium MarineAlpha9_Bin4]|tara:strand:+ start:220 stop:846 length:627 start_codon:yes stop_codon:yes gene_type:complete